MGEPVGPFTRPNGRRTLRARLPADSFTKSAHSRSVHSPFGSFLRMLVRKSVRPRGAGEPTYARCLVIDSSRRSLRNSLERRSTGSSSLARQPRVTNLAALGSVPSRLCARTVTRARCISSCSCPHAFSPAPPEWMSPSRFARVVAPTRSARTAQLLRIHSGRYLLRSPVCDLRRRIAQPGRALLAFIDLLLPRTRLKARTETLIASHTRAIATQISKACATPAGLSRYKRLSEWAGDRVLWTSGDLRSIEPLRSRYAYRKKLGIRTGALLSPEFGAFFIP
jgi:hypothetical protein